jgi:hypothetical protein
MIKKQAIILLILLTTLFACAKTDPVTGEKVLIEVNPKERARAAAEKDGGLFGDLGGKKSSGTNYEFATSNILWRATLKSLDFLPLINADYSGGIIVYDWYSDSLNSNEQVKISVRFLSNELRSDSIEVIAHKKSCDENNKCSTIKLNNNLPGEIKDKILFSARSMKVEEAKNKVKN